MKFSMLFVLFVGIKSSLALDLLCEFGSLMRTVSF